MFFSIILEYFGIWQYIFYMNPDHQITEIQALTHEIKKLNKNFAWYQSLFRGIVTGFGTAVGAGLVVAVFAIIFEQLTGLPILGQLFAFIVGTLPPLR